MYLRRVQFANCDGMEPERALVPRSIVSRCFSRPISGPKEPEIPEADRLRDTTLWSLLQRTPAQRHGVGSEEFQVALTEDGKIKLLLLARARRHSPSVFKQ